MGDAEKTVLRIYILHRKKFSCVSSDVFFPPYDVSRRIGAGPVRGKNYKTAVFFQTVARHGGLLQDRFTRNRRICPTPCTLDCTRCAASLSWTRCFPTVFLPAKTLPRNVKGTAIMHLGRQRHGAMEIHDGERMNLIMWNRGSAYRETFEYDSHVHQRESSRPDKVCLSYTHDRDFYERDNYSRYGESRVVRRSAMQQKRRTM